MSLSSIFRRGPLRFGLLISFIVLTAALARLAELRTGWILTVIAIAWVLAALIERSAHRAAATAKATRDGATAAAAAAPLATSTVVAAPDAAPVVDAATAPVTVEPAAGAAAPTVRPRPASADDELWLVDDAEIDPAPAPLVPWSQPMAPLVPWSRPLTPPGAGPEPEPEPELLFPPPPRLGSSSSLPRGTWNLWELEGKARDAAGAEPGRDEERSLILMYLREFASVEGMLGPEFDDLVRDSFGDLLPPR